MRKSLLFPLLLALLAWGSASAGETRISISQFVEHPALDAVQKGIRDYFAEQEIPVRFKVHNAQANMGTATQIARQMLGERADLLIAIATPSAQACAQALKRAPDSLKRPLLFTAVTDPLAAGLVPDLRHPGGEITGVSDRLPVAEHLKMVREFMPDLRRLGVLYNAGEANSKSTVAAIRALGSEMGLEIVEATAARTADVYQAAQSLVGRADAIFIPTDNTIVSALESVIQVGIRHRLPVFAADVDSVARGAVAAMGFDYYRHGLQTGAMARRILQGTPPGEIPVAFQHELALQINEKSARRMGIEPPPALLAKAAKVYR